MRMCLKVTIPADKGNEALRSGTMIPAMDRTIQMLKPEAAYFLASEGQRCALIFFDMASTADITMVLEPFWLNLEADLELVPAMNIDDLKEGLAKLPHM